MFRLTSLALALALAACALPSRPDTPLPGGTSYRRLGRFASAAEFDGYLKQLRAAADRRLRRQRAKYYGLSQPSTAAPAAEAAAAAPAPAPAPAQAAKAAESSSKDESITNNQESGVDEGDIVKAAGDFFVILRRGRLFTVRQREAGRPVLRPVSRCNAFPEGGSRGTWYDEMLLDRDRVIVVGFSYQVAATELGLFRLGKDGRIRHEATHFLRSNDYYSSRNYASRLVDGKLIVYMPYSLNVSATGDPALPAVATWSEGRKAASDWSPVLSKVSIYRPVQATPYPTLHTVVQCDLRRGFACSARAVLGPYSRTFYVSRDAVYVWVGAGWDGAADEHGERDEAPVYLYRMPILKGEVTAIRARGTPIDQFSFKEDGGRLHVVVTDSSAGDAMWGPEHTRSRLALLRLRLRDFDETPRPVAESAYTALPAPREGYSFQNRFVGEHLLWGAGGGWYGGGQASGRVYVTSVGDPKSVTELALAHQVDRLEAMGGNAVVVGGGKDGLVFSAVELTEKPALRGTYLHRGATQGETRSHGFFFQPDDRGGGLLGLPVRLQGAPWRHLVEGSAEVVMLQVSGALSFSHLGALAARQGNVQDACVVSCVDWYGNARPIFFRGRVFALLGYELVEGSLESGRLSERTRIDYLQPERAEVIVKQ